MIAPRWPGPRRPQGWPRASSMPPGSNNDNDNDNDNNNNNNDNDNHDSGVRKGGFSKGAFSNLCVSLLQLYYMRFRC